MPKIKMNLKYKPIEAITKAPHYIKYVPTVYMDALNFDFVDNDYEIDERDRKFLKDVNESIRQGGGKIASKDSKSSVMIKQQELTEHELERFIDNVEKIHQKTKNKSDAVMVEEFYRRGDPILREKISQEFLIQYLLSHWRRGGKRVTRKFWENPDANDMDVSAAFKKRNEPPKMQLRRNE